MERSNALANSPNPCIAEYGIDYNYCWHWRANPKKPLECTGALVNRPISSALLKAEPGQRCEEWHTISVGIFSAVFGWLMSMGTAAIYGGLLGKAESRFCYYDATRVIKWQRGPLGYKGYSSSKTIDQNRRRYNNRCDLGSYA